MSGKKCRFVLSYQYQVEKLLRYVTDPVIDTFTYFTLRAGYGRLKYLSTNSVGQDSNSAQMPKNWNYLSTNSVDNESNSA